MSRGFESVRHAHRNEKKTVAPTWLALDSACAAGWFAVAILLRLPFVLRAEGALDHDQSVVGLMALDIAAGRRFPLFFDGQRYMGAVEAYVAAGFTRLLGHSPSSVMLAPVLFYGLFVAGQYGLWRHGKDRATGNLAALLALVGAPLMTIWGILPRGGYVECLAWALPTLGVYRAVTAARGSPRTAGQAAGWGFLLAVGYFLNPLSQIVYATLAFDWTFGCQGAALRRIRSLDERRLQHPDAPGVWLLLGATWVLALSVFCHVDPLSGQPGRYYVFCLDRVGEPWGKLLGTAGVGVLLVLAAWWSCFPQRAYRSLSARPWFLAGVLLALVPEVLQHALVHLGVYAPAEALPAWIRAPWKAWPNFRDLGHALGILIGARPNVLESVWTGQGMAPPLRQLPALASLLHGVSPLVVLLVLVILLRVAKTQWSQLRTLAALRGRGPSDLVTLMLLVGFLGIVMYLLQGTSPDASSVRYLVPLWVALPGLLAVGLRTMPRQWAWASGLAMVLPWGLAQWSLLADMDRRSPVLSVVLELETRGVRAIVGAPPVALMTANLSHGEIGSVEYQPIWKRLGTRYLDRVRPGSPIVCVTDLAFPWPIQGVCAPPQWDLEAHLRALAASHPRAVRRIATVGSFNIWEADLPISVVLDGASERPNVVLGARMEARTEPATSGRAAAQPRR